MRKFRFTESQIVSILRDGDAGIPIAELVLKHGIGRATYFNWKSNYADATIANVKRMKELEAENLSGSRRATDCPPRPGTLPIGDQDARKSRVQGKGKLSLALSALEYSLQYRRHRYTH